jgi:uncharacterized membrane protein YjdF
VNALRRGYAFQLCGVITVSAGFGLLETWAGVVVGGLGLIALGVAAELTPGS